jgi:hypothetical protein
MGDRPKTYGLDAFTGTTWKEFRNAGAQITGFRASRKAFPLATPLRGVAVLRTLRVPSNPVCPGSSESPPPGSAAPVTNPRCLIARSDPCRCA